MKEAARCCGMGGLFNLTHYGLSLEILNHKLDMLKEMGVEMVATSCSGCMLHFIDGIHQRGMKIKVLHLLEVLETEQGR
jgi:glycolate oxidase iron-sulfur subunit